MVNNLLTVFGLAEVPQDDSSVDRFVNNAHWSRYSVEPQLTYQGPCDLWKLFVEARSIYLSCCLLKVHGDLSLGA